MTRTRTYTRDSRGRFASTGTSNTARPKTKITTTGVNRLTRDNAGRITSVGGNGATVRGGRLRTAAGNRRGAIMAQMSLNRLGTIGKPKGLKSAALNGRGEGNTGGQTARLDRKPDQAEVNIRGRFTGQAGKRFSASIDRAVAQVKAEQRSRWIKPKAQVKAEAAARKAEREAAAAARPRRVRTPLSLRTSRARRIVKEREMKISGTLRQWENSRRTQERALSIYAKQRRQWEQSRR